MKGDGSNLAVKEKVGIVNLHLQAKISQVYVYMNNKLVSANAYNFHGRQIYRLCYVLVRTNRNLNCKVTCSRKMNSVSANSGFVNRYEFTKESRTLELERNLMADVLNLDKYLINGVDIFI